MRPNALNATPRMGPAPASATRLHAVALQTPLSQPIDALLGDASLEEPILAHIEVPAASLCPHRAQDDNA
jgi:hypothetical protein